jgi:hypothetical protein
MWNIELITQMSRMGGDVLKGIWIWILEKNPMIYIIIGFINFDLDEIMILILRSQPKLKHGRKCGK